MSDEEVRAGQAVYSPFVLKMYDVVVLDVSCRLLWRCPKQHLVGQYDRNVTGEHLDIGVGTGYHLDHCRFPVERPRITLVDLNPNTLAYTAQRVERYDVTTHQASALEPLGLPEASYGSASLSLVLHCLPGEMATKANALSNAAACVRPGGVVFGSTILSEGVPTSRAARFMMERYNQRGIFHNRGDSLDAFRDELDERFSSHKLEVRGCVALFEASVG